MSIADEADEFLRVAEDVDVSLASLVEKGYVEVDSVVDGEPSYRLTEAGLILAQRLYQKLDSTDEGK